MRILTWNINGIRTRSSIKDELTSLDADIVCFQETKVTRDMLEEPIAIVDGYTSYFSFSKKKTGYSGVATFCRDSCMPFLAEEGLGGAFSNGKDGNVGCYGDVGYFSKDELESLDSEGRAVITQHKVKTDDGEVKDLAIINVYVPRVDCERPDRREYKLRFLSLLQTRAEALLNQGSFVIVLGDMNISHRIIDHCYPDAEDFHDRPDRQWLNRFLWGEGQDSSLEVKDEQELLSISTPSTKGGLFVDSFRYFHPDEKEAYTCWCTVTSARVNNYGTRLDYIFGDVDLVKTSLTDCVQLPDVEGSDHCPVKAEFKLSPVASQKPPSFCTKFMPEFAGKQQKLSSFFAKANKKEIAVNNTPIESLQESGASSTDRKRSLTEDSTILLGKKPKLETKKSSETGKQPNLMNFFRKTNSKSKEPVPPKTSLDLKADVVDGKGDSEDRNGTASLTAGSVEKIDPKQETKPTSSAVWKGLLGGLPKPPVCKGHKEPCVLRMVKKDGPNKFKQFYVCARADGPSSNPESRCDHFEWLDKKKLKK